MPEMGTFIAFAPNSVAPVIAVNKGPGDASVRNSFLPGESKVKSDGVRFYQKSCPTMLRLPVDRVRHSLGIPTSSLDEEPVLQLTPVNKIVHNTRLSVLSFQTVEKNTDIQKFWLTQPIMASTFISLGIVFLIDLIFSPNHLILFQINQFVCKPFHLKKK